jgi:hypothetical protein
MGQGIRGQNRGGGSPTCTGCFSAGFATPAPLSAGAAVERAAEAGAGADAIGVSGEIFFRRERRSEEAAEEEEGFNGMRPWRGVVVVAEVARFMRPPSRSSACVRRAATVVGSQARWGICVGERVDDGWGRAYVWPACRCVWRVSVWSFGTGGGEMPLWDSRPRPRRRVHEVCVVSCH